MGCDILKVIEMGPWTRFVDNVSSKLAFFPPYPPTYTVQVSSSKVTTLQSSSQTLTRLNHRVTLHIISTPRLKAGGGGQEIVAAWIPCRNSAERTTILYSHPNAVDLGQVLPLYLELSRILQVNIFTYDYSGYGASSGEPSVHNSLADITAAFDFLCSKYNKRPKDVVLYGQSVGSGPTVYLASKVPDLAGVILHAPLLSGMRVLYPGLACWPRCVDIYPNTSLIKRVQAIVLVMHGTEDEVIDVRHGKRLFKLARRVFPSPLWAAGYNHQNLETCPLYIPTLRQFLACARTA